MAPQNDATLSAEAALALAHTPQERRDALRIFFELDQRLARIVAATSEPMLGQMRLAWWREMLENPVSQRPSGDAVLDAIGERWEGRERALMALVDGWEALLAEPPLSEESAREFAGGRVEALVCVFADVLDGEETSAARTAIWQWALADLASKVSLDEERDMLIDLGLEQSGAISRLPVPARGIAVLGALGLRSLKRGGRPLMEGRGASLVATRAAILGR